MKKTILAIILTTFLFSFVKSQEVDINDNKVLIDNKEILKYEKSGTLSFSFYSLSDDKEILYFNYNDNETQGYFDDDYIIFNFLVAEIKIESKKTEKVISGLGFNSKKIVKKIIYWLLKEKVFNTDGTIDSEKLKTFQEKYDENITNRTIRD